MFLGSGYAYGFLVWTWILQGAASREMPATFLELSDRMKYILY
jgi:hypothetical protein